MKLNFSEIPKFIINLERNTSRREHCEEEFSKHNIHNVHYFNAVDKNDVTVPEISVKNKEGNAAGILACALSHIEVIKQAKKYNYPAVCVFEGDVIFCEDFKDRLEYIEQLQDFDFDILCLGGHFSNKEISSEEAERTQWSELFKIKKMNGTYAYIFTEKVYDFILRNWSFQMGSDEFYSTHVYHRFNTYAMVPFLVGCGKNKSDITGQEFEYENIKWHFNKPRDSWSRLENPKAEPVKFVNEKNFADLMDCTFIIPVKIESEDRAFNFVRCVKHLCDTLKTNIIIKEAHPHSAVLELLKNVDRKFCTIEHVYEFSDNATFHRTRHLNQMIRMCKTPVIINYDVDCLLKKETYVEARNKIINEGFDLIYPYGKEEDQVQITFNDKQNYTADLFNTGFHSKWGSLCGHAQFFNAKSYREGFMENESFISYGPEDRERMERFIKLGYKIEWLSNHKVFHIEHSRGNNSSTQNVFYGQNEALYYRLSAMNKEQLIEYYSHQEYIAKTTC